MSFDCVRLVKYDEYHDYIDRSYEGEEQVGLYPYLANHPQNVYLKHLAQKNLHPATDTDRPYLQRYTQGIGPLHSCFNPFKFDITGFAVQLQVS